MMRRQHVIPNFFKEAEVMREALDVCFKNTYTQSVNWQYFCDPRMYTYLRTTPQSVFPRSVFDRFLLDLRTWCIDNLGLMPVHTPYLHLMVNGCRLGLHSDFHNGAWGYVYSLTRWESRKFSGGETLLMRDGVPSYKKHHVQGEVLYELIPANFNQLLVFDDRIVHATPTIEGTMDPLDGRIALVGHIRATSPVVKGSLQASAARRVLLDALPHLGDRIRSHRDVQGTITYKLTIDPAGRVESVKTLTDNLVTPFTGYAPSEAVTAVRSVVQQTVTALKFPAAEGNTTIIAPILLPLPDLHPIELTVQHTSSSDGICEWLATHLGECNGVELQGSRAGQTIVIQEPIAGSIRVEPRLIAAHFDAPMWVPSQRERFQVVLTEWLKTASTNAVN